MLKIIKILCVCLAFLTALGIAVFFLYRDHSRKTSLAAAESISAKLVSDDEIERVINGSRVLAASDLEAIPNFSTVVEQDLGPDAISSNSFYLLSQQYIDSFQFGWLPGKAPWRGQFIMHGSTGVVYYAGLPQSMADSLILNKTTTIQKAEITQFNPFIGWAPWSRNILKAEVPCTLAYAGIYWRDLEPEKGKFEFAAVEAANQFDFCREHGIRLILRIILDYPNLENQSQLPQWLYDEIGGDGVWYGSDEKGGFSPNYENQILINEHQRLISALGNRYDKDPSIAFIQMGSLGHYGEWHVTEGAGNMPSPAITEKYVDQYRQAFPDKVFMFRRPVSEMLNMRAGLYNDMIGNSEQTDRWLNWIKIGGDDEFPEMTAQPDFWQNGPSGGEFANGDPSRFLTDESFAQTLAQIDASHTSLIGPSAPTEKIAPEIDQNANELLSKMGYRLSIDFVSYPKAARPGTTIKLLQQWENTGNSPMYYSWPIVVNLCNNLNQVVASATLDVDIRKILPGTIQFISDFTIPEFILPGEYFFTTSINDPSTNSPGIYLTTAGRLENGSYQTGRIVILP